MTQQTLGGITGTVTDSLGGALVDTTVSLVNDQTTLTRVQKTNDAGSYDFVNLPIGTYTLTLSHSGFQTVKIPSILVQADRTATVNASLKVGEVGMTVTVEASPLMNSVDTTNGYVLDREELEAVPLPTGSFTGLAILSPGVNAELSAGNGVNSGLGNQPIWANGQRDTSNTFMMNGVDASNLFNGKSTSSVASARIVNNTGIGGAASLSSTTAEPIQSTASPYLAIGQALPTPAAETIQEFRVNTSMYDAQQGSTSGAHIDMSTSSGTNNFHGSAYVHRGTNALNAAPFFYNADPNIPASDKVPQLHRYTAGGELGAPIIKNKLFAYLGFQHTHNSDQETGSSRVSVPPGLTNDRSAAALAALVNGNFPSSATVNPTVGTPAGDISPIAFGLMNYKLPDGQYLIPSAGSFTPTINFPENTFTTGTAYFLANQAVSNLDWIVNSKDTLALKYYYQHDPSIAPYAYSGSPGFTQHLDAGSQVASITNTQMLTPNLSIAEVFGFLREKVYSTIAQPFTPQQFSTYVQNLTGLSAQNSTINTFGSTFFPGLSIVDNYGNSAPYNVNFVPNAGMNIGDGANSQGAFTGVFQNRFMPSANAIWTRGRHTFTFGGSFAYTQLNTRDERTNKGTIAFADFSQFLQGLETSYSPNGFVTSAFLQGDANRYYRAKDTGAYLQDKFQLRSNLSVTAGLRFDDHGGLTEKYGRMYNFEPSLYNYDAATDAIVNSGFIIAGNNKLFPTKGVSNSTLTGRQWGLAPRVGLAWSPTRFHGKVVVRAGWGMYYDRGELFTYLSPGVAAGVIAGGPFGVNQAPPFVNSQVCTAIGTFYESFIPTCDSASPNGGSFNNPWGASLQAPPTGNPASIVLPNAAAIANGSQLFAFADYNRANKLPYTFNQILDLQWQPRKDLLIEVGYVGNLGRHEVIPVPFNQAGIATPSRPIHGQNYTYGYNILAPPGCNPTLNAAACAYTPTCNASGVTSGCGFMGLPDGSSMIATYEGGNVDLRVPYIGYSSESESYTAAGVSAYNALQTHIEKRLSHGLQVGFSYTFSHSTDEQSGMGLFYNGNNATNLRSGYGLSDFDRKHVMNFTYMYQLPKFFEQTSLKGRFADGWAIEGLAIIQSGQPYSIVDYSGAVGGIFYGTSDGITNPIVPLGSCTPSKALTGTSGATPGLPALNAACFTLPLLNPGDLGGAIPAGDTYETNFTTGQRNIFRQAWQKRTDLSVVKVTQLTERASLKFSFDVFNLTNTPSFDIPIDNVSQNLFFNDFPVFGSTLYSSPTASGLGIVNKTIGSPRQIQMTLRLAF
ncbi:MAG TPA: TonB-dependent receptor [Candidatus Saccharimonadales bacterium]|nr:TonB-dependent receptor [Candidatus Saccharimonadales bacterium]